MQANSPGDPETLVSLSGAWVAAAACQKHDVRVQRVKFVAR